MKTGIKILIAVVGLAVHFAWTVTQTNNITKAEWLIGTWENPPTGQPGKTPRGSIYETWSKTNDNEFSGMSYIIKEKDTVVFENIRLVQEQSGLFYIPTVKNQNDGLPVRFATKTISEVQMVFENPEHDFPQIISYTKINTDSLVAEISGVKNGQERKQTFPMRRVK
jgi:hypothetical protein